MTENEKVIAREGTDFIVRGAWDEDLPFIRGTWVRNAEDWSFTKAVDEYWIHQKGRIQRIFKRDTCRMLVCCAEDNRSEILGFIVGEPELSAIHFIYVKSAYRKWGLGTHMVKTMFTNGPTIMTQYNEGAVRLRFAGKLPLTMKYNPYWFEEQR